MADGRSANNSDNNSSSSKIMDGNAETSSNKNFTSCNNNNSFIVNNKGVKHYHSQENGNNDQQNGHGHHHTHSKTTTEKKPIRLNSPTGSTAVSWHWSEKDKTTIGIEVLEIIRLTIFYYPELEGPLKSRLGNADVANYDQVRSLAKKFNKALKETSQTRRQPSRPKDLFHQIITRCYNRAVENEKALNKHYEAFSSQTYGETSYDRMKMIIEELKPDVKDVFVDLGSGVGQLVAHIAGATSVQKAVGIEIAQLPSKFAKKLEIEFRKWMNWFGRPFRPFELKEGDFLADEYRKLVTEEATIIFINNYAFQSDLESRIKRELLSDLKDGTRIISTKPYVPLNKQGAITNRQLNDISVIIDVLEMKACPNPCSWTSAYVPYYLHTINRAKLERYFLTLRNTSLRAKSSDTGSRRSSTPNSKASNSRESSVGMSREKSSDTRVNGDEVCFGPTTRRKWNDYVTELEMQKKMKNKRTQPYGTTISAAASSSSASSSDNSSTAASTPSASNGGGQHQVTTTTNNNLEAATIKSKAVQMPTIKMEIETNNTTQLQTIPITTSSVSANVDDKSKDSSVSSSSLTSVPILPNNNDVCSSTLPSNPKTTELVQLPAVETTPKADESILTVSSNIPTLPSSSSLSSPKFEPISPAKPISSKRPPAKRSYERKAAAEKANTTGARGRPRKADKMAGGVGTHISPKMPRLSNDAKDGMELMHQMTCAAQSGKPMDTAAILADMANNGNQYQQQQPNKTTPKGRRQSGASTAPDFTSHFLDTSLPFPSLANPPGLLEKQNDVGAVQYTNRYPGLNKFIDRLRNVYESWFDDLYNGNANSDCRQQPHSSSTLNFIKEEPLTIRVDNNNALEGIANFTPSNGCKQQSQQQFRSILDQQTPLKRSQGHEQMVMDLATNLTGNKQENNSKNRIMELQRRVQERHRRMLEKLAEFQEEMQKMNTDMDALMAEHAQHQQKEAAVAAVQQSQNLQQQQQLVAAAAAQQQQQLIAAAQAQLAAAAAVAVQQQQQSAVNQVNQLELLINEMRQRYSQQLTAQHLLAQIDQLGLMNTIAPQEIAALQSLAAGAALNGANLLPAAPPLPSVNHQMSPVAAAAVAAALQSPVAQAAAAAIAQQGIGGANNNIRPQPGPSPAFHQLNNNNINSTSDPIVQNFLSTFDHSSKLNSSNGSCSGNGTSATNISANVAAVSAELAHAAANHSMNSASTVNTQQLGTGYLHQLGQSTATLSLHQTSQNFTCPSQPTSSSFSSSCGAVINSIGSIQQQQQTHESTVAEIVAEVAALPATLPRKPFRPRPPRANCGNKRSAQNAQKQHQMVDDPKKQEEIERQIQDIVAKALEVDSAAKSAEKDRKARGGEKRTKEKSGANSSANNTHQQLSQQHTSTTVSSLQQQSHLISTTLADNNNAKLLPPMVQPLLPAQTPSSIEFQVKADNVIMQNFLTAAVAASQKQQQTIVGSMTTPGTPSAMSTGTQATILDSGKRTPSLNASDIRMALGMAAAAAASNNAATTTTPKLQSPSFGNTISAEQQQQQFTFAPSSISLAIQGVCGASPTAPQSTFSTPSSANSMKHLNSLQNSASPPVDSGAIIANGPFLHSGESCSPPFISLNLPPTNSAMIPPPTNVVVKVESKLAPSRHAANNHPTLP